MKKNKVIAINATVQPKEKAEIQALATQREWSASRAAGYLIRLGLETISKSPATVRQENTY